jgi:hypothetical protein
MKGIAHSEEVVVFDQKPILTAADIADSVAGCRRC